VINMTAELHRWLQIMGRPSYVKAASEQPHRSGNDYPTQSREATYLSWCRAVGEGAPTHITTKLAEMGRFWGISNDLERAETNWKVANEVRPLRDDEFALCQTYKGARIRKFAAYDAPSTVKAAEAFYDHRTKYPYSWRKEAATRLLRKAAETKAMLPEYLVGYLHKAAGLGYPTSESIEKVMVGRFNHTGPKHEEITAKLASVLELIADNPSLRYNDELVKSAMQVLDQFDHETGVADKYHKVAMPEELIGMTEPELQKMAAEQEGVVTLVNGAEVKLADLNPELLGAVDPSLAKLSQAELADTLPTLPRPDSDLLVRLLAG
jgi:hypothetical protein